MPSKSPISELKKELIDFLNEQDIYLNFSEYEGTSLTMLEAMASGCVPVVTDVSGVSDFIEDGVNGLVSDIGDLDGGFPMYPLFHSIHFFNIL